MDENSFVIHVRGGKFDTQASSSLVSHEEETPFQFLMVGIKSSKFLMVGIKSSKLFEEVAIYWLQSILD